MYAVDLAFTSVRNNASDVRGNISNTATATFDQHTKSSVLEASLATSATTTTTNPDIISDEVRNFFEVMNFVILSGVISLTGTVCNIINMVVFTKQGLTEPVNISLLGLSVSDLAALVTLVWMSICFNPLFVSSGIEFDSIRVQYLTAGWPHVCCARITSWITAFIALERCLCISIPLKVKTIITPNRTKCVIVCIFTIMILSVCPVYYAIRLGPVYDAVTNTTRISLVYRPHGTTIENISFAINLFAQLSSFVFVIVCTIVLIHSLHRNCRWRQKAITTGAISRRDKRLIKMIVLLSVIFIVCFLPSAVNLIVMIFTPGYSIIGIHANMFQVGWSFLNTLEATNSSVSILVYYKMSSRYRAVLKRVFGFQSSKRHHQQRSISVHGVSS